MEVSLLFVRAALLVFAVFLVVLGGRGAAGSRVARSHNRPIDEESAHGAQRVEEDDDDDEEEEEHADDDDDDGAEETRRLKNLALSYKTRARYVKHLILFMTYLWHGRHRKNAFSTEFRKTVLEPDSAGLTSELEGEGNLGKRIEKYYSSEFGSQDNMYPWASDSFQIVWFQNWMSQLKREKGDKDKPLGQGALSSRRSAFNYSFDFCGVPMPPPYKLSLSGYFKGKKKDEAAKRAKGELPAEEGKEALPFELYELIARTALKMNTKRSLFVYVVLVLGWNLCSRVNNVVNIRVPHMVAVADSIRVYFPKTKSDGEGERGKYGRHIYANPDNLFICPWIALAIWISLNPDFDEDKHRLFPGSENMENRFSQGFTEVLQHADVQAALKRLEIDASRLASHSIRKGSLTFAMNGTTAPPSIISLELRAGWTVHALQKRYLKWEAAGDQYIGRILAGLNVLTAKFASLGARVKADCSREFGGHAKFPKFGIASTVLAHLVFFAPELKKELTDKHMLFQSTFFAQGQAALARKYVELPAVTAASVHSSMVTGVPPHCVQALVLEEIRGATQRSEAALASIPGMVREVVEGVIQETQASRAEVTQNSLVAALAAVEERLGEKLADVRSEVLVSRAQAARGGSAAAAAAAADTRENGEDEAEQALYKVHMWEDGTMSTMPENFEWNITTLESAWTHWCIGNRENGYPPFSGLTASDFKDRRTFSDFKVMCSLMKLRLQVDGKWQKNPSADLVHSWFDAAVGVLNIPPKTKGGKPRNFRRLAWGTVAKTIMDRSKETRRELEDKLKKSAKKT